MEVTAHLDAPHPPNAVFPWVSDLVRYPSWLDIVRRVDREPEIAADGVAGTAPGEAWTVELRARLGPIARSKRLRMVRSGLEPDRSVRFERLELDGRHHAAWVLDALLTPTSIGCRLDMGLRYDGGALAPLVQRLLESEIDRCGRRLLELVAAERSAPA